MQVRIDEIRWMNKKQAAAYSNIGEKRLIELARNGDIRGFQDPAVGGQKPPWIFDKLYIDKYRENQMPNQLLIDAKVDKLRARVL